MYEKNGKNITYKSKYNSKNEPTHALGGWYTYTISYLGILKSNALIEGQYSYGEDSYTSNGNFYNQTITANFIITKK